MIFGRTECGYALTLHASGLILPPLFLFMRSGNFSCLCAFRACSRSEDETAFGEGYHHLPPMFFLEGNAGDDGKNEDNVNVKVSVLVCWLCV